MSNFKFRKTVLVVSTTAAMAGMLVGGQALAQVNNEKGSLQINGYVFATTCALNIDSTASTTAAAASKTLDLGSFSVATASAVAPGSAISKPASVVLSLKEANGTGCVAIAQGARWDVSVDLPASAFSTTNLTGKHTLNNTVTTNGATGAAASFTVAVNGGTPFPALIGNKTGAFGHMLSGSTTVPSLTATTDTLTLTAELYRLTTGTLGVGEYRATLPLTVVYR